MNSEHAAASASPTSSEERLRVEVRLSREEKKRLHEAASLAGLTVSEFVRRCSFGRPVLATADMAVVRELRRLGGLLKHVHLESGGAYSAATAGAIASLRNYIDRLGAAGSES